MQKAILLLTILFINITASSQITLNLLNGEQLIGLSEQLPQRTVTETSNGYTVTYKFSSVNLVESSNFPNAVELSINTFGTIQEAGKPYLPIRYEDFIIPEGKKASVSLVSSKYKDFNLEISPAIPMTIESGDITASGIPTISDYSGYYPQTLVDIYEKQFFRNIEILTVSISPAKYDMNNKIVRIFTELVFKVDFEEASPVSIQSGDIDDVGRLEFDFSYPNLDESGGTGNVYVYSIKPVAEQPIKKDYLVISAPIYKVAVEKLCEWKRTLGFTTHVEYRDDWTTANIKSIVYNFASTHPNFTHLLLFGDYQRVPSNLYTNQETGTYYTDLDYACLNGSNDFYPDVLYGRIPATNVFEAETIVDKSISFEKNPIDDSQFYNTHIYAALFDFDSNLKNGWLKENLREYTATTERIRRRLATKGYASKFIYKKLYPSSYFPGYWFSEEQIPSDIMYPNYEWNGCANDIKAAINEGSSMVLYRGHGTWSEWQPNFFTNDDVLSLSNGIKCPVVFSIACSTGKLVNGNGFTESFLNNSNGGACIVLSATNSSYTIHNNYLADGLFEAMWPKDNFNYPVYEVGAIMNTGFRIANHYCVDSKYYHTSGNGYQRQIYHCYGDPSLRVFTSAPKEVDNVVVTREKNRLKVSCKRNMYISVYDPTTLETSLVYGMNYEKLYPLSFGGGATTDTQALIVCVYDNNYKPKLYKGLTRYPIGLTTESNEMISCNLSRASALSISYSVEERAYEANIIIADMYGNKKIIIACDTSVNDVSIDVSALCNGVYIVNYIVDGELCGSSKFVK